MRPGDSLWSIAAARLGDGDDWPAIAALNLGRTMADGLQFVDPNTIHAGWTLEMPDGAAPLAPDADRKGRTRRTPSRLARHLARWLSRDNGCPSRHTPTSPVPMTPRLSLFVMRRWC